MLNAQGKRTHEALAAMLYDYGVAVTPDDGSDISGSPYNALYIGTGGDVKVDLHGGGSVTFSNLASGQLLPVLVDRVYSTGTTATNILALK